MAARPATRRSPASSRVVARPPVRDFGAGAPISIEWDVRTAYDFLFSLSGEAGTTDDLPTEDRQWLKAARASLPKPLQTSMGRLFDSEVAIHTVPLFVEDRDVRSSADVVGRLKKASPTEMVRSILIAVSDPSRMQPLTESLPAATKAVEADIMECLPAHKRKSFLALVRDPEGTYTETIAVLTAWQERFASVEDRVQTILERDYALRAEDRRTLSDLDLIEHATGGVRWLPEVGVRRVILAPSYFSRPYNFLFGGGDWRFFGYPVADDAVGGSDPLAPPLALIRLHRALGDDTRLRILKLLADRDLYLTEIAQLLDLSKPTIKHHLRILRVAGLVTMTESGAVTYYTLRRDPLKASSADIRQFLTSPGASTSKPPG